MTAKVDANNKNVHVTFQKNITEELKEVIADIEVINTENGQIAHFDDVKIGKDGKIIDDTIYTFDGLLNKDFFLPSNQISGGGNGSDGSTGFPPPIGEDGRITGDTINTFDSHLSKNLFNSSNLASAGNGSDVKKEARKGFLPQTGEEWHNVLTTIGIILVLALLVFLITRRRKQAGNWLLVGMIIAGGAGFSGTAEAANRGNDLVQHESFQDGSYTINVDVHANFLSKPTDQTNLTVKDSTIYVGDSWTAEDNFVSATDKDGNDDPFSDITVDGTVDATKTGEYQILYKNGDIEKTATITVKAVQTSLKVKDSTIYVGDNWTPEDNFVSATDKDGKPFRKIIVKGTVDITTAGEYPVLYKNGDIEKTATITVKAVQTSLEVKDATISVGDNWTAEDNFVSATDKDGDDVPYSEIIVEGTVNASKCGDYTVVYKNDSIEKIATITVIQNPDAPVENPDGSISFVGKNWDIIKDYGDGTKMIAMQDKISESQFNLTNFFNRNDNNLDGYQDSIIKPIVDGWYQNTIAGTTYEQYVEPVSLSNPTLGTMKGLGWSSNTAGSITRAVWHQEINDPSKYPTIVGNGEKKAFLMSGSDLTTDAQGNLSQAAITHKDKLASNGIYYSWLRSPGSFYSFSAYLVAGYYNVYGSGVEFTDAVVPSLAVHIPSCK